MTQPLQRLIDALRTELEAYGEMLALLDQQQEQVVSRAADDLLQTVLAINSQQAAIRSARLERDLCQRNLSVSLGQPGVTTFAELLPLLSAEHRILVNALVEENNGLILKVQRRAAQNHLLLSRSVELTRTLIRALFPTNIGVTYDENGAVLALSMAGAPVYQDVG
jgi:hypothetical protein